MSSSGKVTDFYSSVYFILLKDERRIRLLCAVNSATKLANGITSVSFHLSRRETSCCLVRFLLTHISYTQLNALFPTDWRRSRREEYIKFLARQVFGRRWSRTFWRRTLFSNQPKTKWQNLMRTIDKSYWTTREEILLRKHIWEYMYRILYACVRDILHVDMCCDTEWTEKFA